MLPWRQCVILLFEIETESCVNTKQVCTGIRIVQHGNIKCPGVPFYITGHVHESFIHCELQDKVKQTIYWEVKFDIPTTRCLIKD